jgi:protein tyrosine/serine phosphatase
MSRKPLPTFDLSRPWDRFRAYLDMLWKDHAYLRLRFMNAHWVGPDLVRTNQPWPFQLAYWKRKHGIRAVLNLRGGGYLTGFYLLERDACARLGLQLIDFPVSSREAPSLSQVEAAKALFETLDYPVLMHCKSGADRAGMMSVLYAHYRLGLPIGEAMRRELSFRTLHVRQGKTGVIDYAFELYLRDGEPKGLSLIDWMRRPEYDPKAIKAEFQAGMWGSLLTEKLLRRE